MKKNAFALSILLFLFFYVSSMSYAQKKRIGFICTVKGPAFFTSNLILINGNGAFNTYFQKYDSLKTDNKFKEIFTFYQDSIISPKNKIADLCNTTLDSFSYEPIIITENINDRSQYPELKKAKTDFSFFLQDISGLKEKYNIDSLLILNVNYGFELEKIMGINSDKRIKINGKIMLIDIHSNKIRSNGHFSETRNIKNWNQPPSYPTFVESYNKALHDEFLPKCQKKLINVLNGKHLL